MGENLRAEAVGAVDKLRRKRRHSFHVGDRVWVGLPWYRYGYVVDSWSSYGRMSVWFDGAAGTKEVPVDWVDMV